MDTNNTKPRLVFFQCRYDRNVPEFLLIHKREHVKCLSQFFDVTVISEDCDYRQVCDTYEPDLALFESGLEVQGSHRLRIENVHSHPNTPKVAFLNSDGCSELRAGIISDLEQWGIDTAFTISLIAGEHTSSIAQNLFVWPNFIDPETFRDYGSAKVVPVLLTGSQSPRYPWRHRVFELVSSSYPSLVCPHTGYSSRSAASQMLYGEHYARTINSAWVAPACGSVTREFVRKHIEIPGCKACLITEASPALEAAGFVDMLNCVFADERDVLDKLAYLFSHENDLAAITQRGYQLVHERHTIRQRDQLLQWFNLYRTRRPDQKIVQTDPFGPLALVDGNSGISNSHILGNGRHLIHFRRGEELFAEGNYADAEAEYLRCLTYLSEFPEAKLKIALCNLHRGRARAALSWIHEPLRNSIVRYQAADPDPVEWAYFILCLLCLGRAGEAGRRSRQFAALVHPELERARWAATLLTTGADATHQFSDGVEAGRRSIHQIPTREFKEWMEQLCVMLRACGQGRLAEKLGSHVRTEGNPVLRERDGNGQGESSRFGSVHARVGDAKQGKGRAAAARPTLSGLDNPELWARIRARLGRLLIKGLRSLEGRGKYFLPFRLSARKADEFHGAVQRLTSLENPRTALLVGVAEGDGHVEAFAAGVRGWHGETRAFCIRDRGQRARRPMPAVKGNPQISWYDLPLSSSEELSDRLDGLVKRIKDEHRITSFDLILIKGYGVNSESACGAGLLDETCRARLVLLDDTSEPFAHSVYAPLLGHPDYVLVRANPGVRHGYAIFRKQRLARAASCADAVSSLAPRGALPEACCYGSEATAPRPM